MSDLVRVSDKRTGHHYTTAQSVVDADPGRYRVLKSAAVDIDGRPLPPKPAAIPIVSAPAETTATVAAEPIEATEEAQK